MNQISTNFKIRVLASTFLLPLAWAIILIIKVNYPSFPFNTWVTTGLLIGSSIAAIFKKNKYLFSIHINNNTINISYLTRFLQQREVCMPIEKVKRFEHEKRDWLIEDFDALWLSGDKQWFRFKLITKEIRKEVQAKIRETGIITPDVVGR